jgi:aminotransferase
MTREELSEIAEILRDTNIVVLSDEIYEKLVYGDIKHVSFASLPGMKERTITLNGFSKCYSMTGWRLGYAAAPESMIQGMVRVHQYVNTCASSFVQEAGITALREAEPDVQVMVKEYERRRNYAVKELNSMDGISCRMPGGAFYIFVNIKSLGKTSAEVAEYLLDHAHVATVPGTAFGKGGEGYIRLSYATAYDQIVEAMDRMRKAFAELKEQ